MNVSSTERRREAILAYAGLALSSLLLLLELAAESNGAGCVICRGFEAGRLAAVSVVGLGPDRSAGFLPFADGSFDLAVAVGLDRARVPARVVLETERVLRPGRFGVVVRSGVGRIRRLVGESAPVTALLRSSDVVGAREVNGSVVVVFKKRGDHVG